MGNTIYHILFYTFARFANWFCHNKTCTSTFCLFAYRFPKFTAIYVLVDEGLYEFEHSF